MAVTYGFFDSKNHDRIYNAEQMSRYFEGLVGNGVVKGIGNQMSVSIINNEVKVANGRAIIDCRWYDQTEPIAFLMTPSSSKKFCSIALRLSYTDRNIGVICVEDESIPVLSDNDYIKWLKLADVEVNGSSIKIINNYIGSEACPLLTDNSNKVDKEEGKGLSTYDFDNLHRNQLLKNAADITELMYSKVDAVEGKSLSTNDFTDAEKNKLSGIEAGAQVNAVTGVKGHSESSYRTGNIDITAANVGAAAASHTHNYAGSSAPGGAANSANKLASARLIDGVSFDGSANIAHYGTCSTAAATAAKVVSCPNFSLVTGARITVIFTNTNSADAITLNVNNTGAKAVYYLGAAMTNALFKIPLNTGVDFIYDGSHWVYCGNQSYVSQFNDTSNADHRLLLSASATDAQERASTRKSGKFTANPATGELKSSKFITNRLSDTDSRYTEISPGQVRHHINPETGYGGGMSFYSGSDSSSIAGIGAYFGANSELQYYYFGKSYNSAVVKIAPDGTVTAPTFKGNLSGNAQSLSAEQTSLYKQSLMDASSPVTVNISGLFTKYKAVICNVHGESSDSSCVLPLSYVKTCTTLPYYDNHCGHYFQYVDDDTMKIHTGFSQSNPKIYSVEIISLY